MNRTSYSKGYRPVLLFLSVCFFIVSCKQKTAESLSDRGNLGAGYTDFNGAMQYEFDMIKNPITGKIPEGVFEAEKNQAREILERQSISGRTTLANTYIFQGPNNLGGRTRAIAYDVRFNGTSNQVIIAGGVSGGVYKSTDNGATWVRKSPTGEHFSCTSIAQDPRPGSQDTWYYAVGEASGNSASGSGAFYSGNGVYKSTDNGETWARLPNSNTSALESFTTAEDFITKIIVDPTNGNVYIACPATIKRSTDGGANWTTVLSGALSNSGQHTDIIVTSAGRFYAGFSGTNAVGVDGVWTSTTGASASWSRIAGPGGTPTGWNANGAYGRVVLALAPSNEDILYALYYRGDSPPCPIGITEAEFFKWDQSTTTWVDRSANLPDEAGCSTGNDPFAVQGGYDLVLAVKPDDENMVFIGGTNIYRSTDGFATTGNTTRIGGYATPSGYALYTNSHPDIHSIVFPPTSTTTMLCGNDGGIQRTSDNTAGTVSWTQINVGYRTFQYYHVTLDPRISNDKVMGGAQDNGTSRNIGGTGSDFEIMFSGDGVSVGLSDLISSVQYEYVGTQLGNIYRRASTLSSGFGTNITPTWSANSGLFVTLFKLDQDNNSERLYYANNDSLFRTTSASTVTSSTWTNMSGVANAVGSATRDITALATTRGTYSASTSSLFIGTSNGRVFRLDDPSGTAAATVPVDITGGTFPSGYVSSISVNPRNDDTVLVTFSSYGVTSVFWTGNANAASPTWTDVEGSLTLPSYRSSAIVLNGLTGDVEYYVGTSAGLFATDGLPGAINWSQEGATSIGNAVVSSLALRPSDNKLLVGTHGYGMWYTVLPTNPLPVTLTEFKGTLQNKSVLLQWTTASEYNSHHFELEKSFDGVNFRTIASVPAAGTSNILRNYSYSDKEPLTEKNFYRLKSVDIDATFDFSQTVLIKVPFAQQNILVLGNPFHDRILIRFIKEPDGKMEFRLLDQSGKLVARQHGNGFNQQVSFSTPGISSGVYILQVITANTIFTRKLIKN